MFFALGIIAQSVSTALFPTLAALAAASDLDGFRNRLSAAMRSVLFLSIPATVLLILLGEPLIALIAERGAWTPDDTQATAWALAFFALGIAGHSLIEVLSRAFYALHDTWTPVWIGLVSMVANIVLSLIFIRFIGIEGSLPRGPFAGLALANSLTTLLEGGVLWFIMRRRIDGVNDGFVLDSVWRTSAAAAVMGVVIYIVGAVTPFRLPFAHLMVAGVLGASAFFGSAFALNIREARTVPNLIINRIRR
jgi:putative peptidoglycan lipid II flippase